MGVHDVQHYPEIKRLLNIPEDEPIFIIRAQDRAAADSLMGYTEVAAKSGASKEFIRSMVDVVASFAAWRTDNKVKVPD